MGEKLYADGGVIGNNPSKIGGTWAWCRLRDEKPLLTHSGTLMVADAGMAPVSNNVTELLALVEGMESLPDDWVGEVNSDSMNALGRVMLGWRCEGVPVWLRERMHRAIERQVRFPEWKWQLLKGHPTKKELLAGHGLGKNTHPVSKYNVQCDEECKRLAERAFFQNRDDEWKASWATWAEENGYSMVGGGSV